MRERGSPPPRHRLRRWLTQVVIITLNPPAGNYCSHTGTPLPVKRNSTPILASIKPGEKIKVRVRATQTQLAPQPPKSDRRPHLVHHLLVILHAHLRVDLRIGPPEVHQEFAAMLPEGRQIGVRGVQNLPQFFQARWILVDVELAESARRIHLATRAFHPWHHVALEIETVRSPRAGAVRRIDRLPEPAALAVSPRDLGAHRPAGEEPLPIADHIAVNPFQRGNLIRREAIRLLAPRDAARQVARGFEIAAARIVDQPILQSILGVALLVYVLDHAFATPSLTPRITSCRYSHVEREAAISDHSIVIVEIE